MEHRDCIAHPWPDYELLDSGANRKLERFGSVTLVRPETQALWAVRTPDFWNRADAEFVWSGAKGTWKHKRPIEPWTVSWQNAKCTLRLTSFKHVGLFPEQAPNWKWLEERVGALSQPKVLNLFGYTGLASIVAAQAGGQVTHVDASKQSNAWAKENAKLSGLAENAVRFLADDALKFAEREVRRGSLYQGLILDPPAFGRGPDGEVWHIEESLPRLLAVGKKLLDPKPGSFFLLNGYAAGYSVHSFRQMTMDYFSEAQGEYGELHIKESGTERVIPSGIYIRFAR